MRAWWLLLGLAACGDALVDADYRGQPIFKLEGQITARRALPEEQLDASFVVSVFWAPTSGGRVLGLVEQDSLTTSVRFPATFELRVFEPPSDEHFGSARAAWVVGLVLVYIDADGDRRFTAGVDDVVGGSGSRGLVYARSPVAAPASPTQSRLEVGFGVVDLPLDGGCDALASRRGETMEPLERKVCNGGCPEGLVCDQRERVCRPDETFVLFIDTAFAPLAAVCR